MLAVSLAAVTATTTLFAIAGAAGPASAAASSGCPTSKTGVPVATNVAAGYMTTGNVTTYQFSSLTNEHPSAGVPGLIKYCVYPTPTGQPNSTTVTAKGDNGANWIVGTGNNNFAFVRPGGNPSNIGLNGTSTTMGTATWKTVPASQAIVLHINDATTCASLYGAGSSATCFVTPSPLRTGPVCDHGDTNVAYNAMPTDVTNCLNPAIGFEATTASEFGNEVTLAGAARNLSQLKVDFQSFACQTGHWNGVPGDPTTPEPCAVTDPSSPSFQWPITANIYDPNGSGGLTTPIASTTVLQTIPYRPAADTTGHCTGSIGNKWWNPDAVGGGACQNSIGTVLTFNFPSGTVLPGTVVWTVAFTTSDYGPGATHQPCAAGSFPGLVDGGCPYDSLNVGDNGNTGGADFPTSAISGAPYAGSDVTPGAAFVNYADGGFYCSGGAGGSLRLDAGCWDGLRPLGEIITN